MVPFSAPALQVLVSFVLRRVLGEQHSWRYAARAERWRLACTALRLVRYALLAEGAPAGPHCSPHPVRICWVSK